MKATKRPLHLGRETIRQLTSLERGHVAGGVPSSFPQCAAAARAGTTSEAEGNGPCPGEYSYLCKP